MNGQIPKDPVSESVEVGWGVLIGRWNDEASNNGYAAGLGIEIQTLWFQKCV